jgi:hypothetical protein
MPQQMPKMARRPFIGAQLAQEVGFVKKNRDCG